MSPVPSTCDLCDTYKADTSGAFRVLPPVFHSYGGCGPLRRAWSAPSNASRTTAS